jgi:hypothetical protein
VLLLLLEVRSAVSVPAVRSAIAAYPSLLLLTLVFCLYLYLFLLILLSAIAAYACYCYYSADEEYCCHTYSCFYMLMHTIVNLNLNHSWPSVATVAATDST